MKWGKQVKKQEQPVKRTDVDAMRDLIFPDGVGSWSITPDTRFMVPPHAIDMETKGAGAEEIKRRVNAVFADLNGGKPLNDLMLFVQAKEIGLNPQCRINISLPVETFEKLKLGERLQDPAALRAAQGHRIV